MTRFSVFISALLACASSASANPTFVLYDSGGVGAGTQARAGFEAAAALWSSVFTDDVTIRLNVGFQKLGSGILGQTGSSSSEISYNNLRSALYRDRTSPTDASAYSSLDPTFTFYDNLGAGGELSTANRTLDANKTRDNTTLVVNTANQKALGLRVSTSNAVDASVTFSSAFKWTFDTSQPFIRGSYDFVGIAAHEIGHALGFVSGVDTEDWYTQNNYGGLDLQSWATPLDLFRYQGGVRDLTLGGAPCFSVDDGATCTAAFATGYYKGDHQQASHWKDNRKLGIMDPTVGQGETLRISANDLAAFDAIGWDLAPVTAANARVHWSTTPYDGADGTWTVATDPADVPEPGMLPTAALGAVAIALARRRRVASSIRG